MTTPKTTKAIYWTTTAIIFLFEGVVPALTSNTQLAVEGIRHLGYPDYFRVMLTVFKVIGATVLILPFVHSRIKEWAYTGFAITIISAFISHLVVDGANGQTFFPLLILAIVVASYASYHTLRRLSANGSANHKPTAMSLQAYHDNCIAEAGESQNGFEKTVLLNDHLLPVTKTEEILNRWRNRSALSYAYATAIAALLDGTNRQVDL